MEVNDNYPDKGVYCPVDIDHKGQIPHLLFALSDEALFARCREHDWLRIEMHSKGRKIDFKNLSVTVSPVKPRNGRPCVLFDRLEIVPVYAKGHFPLRPNRAIRRGIDRERTRSN